MSAGWQSIRGVLGGVLMWEAEDHLKETCVTFTVFPFFNAANYKMKKILYMT